MPKAGDIRLVVVPGDRFARLTVLQEVERDKHGLRRARVRCDCGKELEVGVGSLFSGNTKSCGCLKQELFRGRVTTHGHAGSDKSARTPEYGVWAGMLTRCRNPKGKQFADYGGRGITVCERWANSFEAFYEDMGERPSPKHSIDRIDVNGGYWCGRAECPDCGPLGREPNCRWADRNTQARNKRNNIRLSVSGETRTLVEWSEVLSMPFTTLYRRVRAGWTPEDVVKPAGALGKNGYAQKTHCPQGHPYDEENTYLERDGGRQCRQCRRVKALEAYYRRRDRERAQVATV